MFFLLTKSDFDDELVSSCLKDTGWVSMAGAGGLLDYCMIIFIVVWWLIARNASIT